MKLANVIIGVEGLGAVWLTVSLPQYWRLPSGTALSSYGSSQQVVSPPVGASIAIAERR